MTEASTDNLVTPRVVGRYALFDEIAAGGMATVHLGRLVGQVGFSRTVAVKRLHPQYAKDQEFVSMFVDEARLASRIQHPNVVSTLDVVKTQDELFLVMEYVQGEALSKLVRNHAKRGERIPPNVVLSVMSGMLHGLQAAHEAKSETREPLNIVHRDISPQNILVGVDGVARVLDFGVAKAAMRSGATRDGQMKGKLSYMSPEQLNGREVDRRGDVFAAGIVLWEALAGKRLFAGADAGEILGKVLASEIPTPRSIVPSLPQAVSDAVMRSLQREPEERFQTAREFAIALEAAGSVATTHAVSEWVKANGGESLQKRANTVARIESHPMDQLEELQTVEEESDSGAGERTSGVVPPVDSDVEPTKPRKVVTMTLVALGALLGLLAGRDLFNPPVVTPLEPATASDPIASATPAPSIVPAAAAGTSDENNTDDGAADNGTPQADSTGAVPSAEPSVAEPSGSGGSPSAPSAGAKPENNAKPPPSKPIRKPPPKRNCIPPYTVSETGIKKPKPWCL